MGKVRQEIIQQPLPSTGRESKVAFNAPKQFTLIGVAVCVQLNYSLHVFAKWKSVKVIGQPFDLTVQIYSKAAKPIQQCPSRSKSTACNIKSLCFCDQSLDSRRQNSS